MTTSPTGLALCVTLPVEDVARTQEFFSALGFAFDPAFGDGVNAAAMKVGEQVLVMHGSREMFAQVSKLPAADPRTHALALFSFAVANRDDVDTVYAAAIAAGGTEADGPEDHGFMYTRAFFDLDGHGWQVMWMNPAAAPSAAEEVGAAA